jgi:hypothetical protein
MERAWYSNVWIGLNDLKTKGVYEWSDGSPVSWTNWYVGQPDERRTDKTCVYMSLRRGKRGWMYWSDQNCTNKYAFICTYHSGKFAIIIALVDELLSSLYGVRNNVYIDTLLGLPTIGGFRPIPRDCNDQEHDLCVGGQNKRV